MGTEGELLEEQGSKTAVEKQPSTADLQTDLPSPAITPISERLPKSESDSSLSESSSC
jgi:hypothetical protein